jgi:enamine deaminase RidA (YjgF/YER057c/UK114 family)
MHDVLHPAGWAPAIGYANGVAAEGRMVFLGGQIGWDESQVFASDDLVDQVRQTLRNIVAILAEAGGETAHLVSMTWFMTDLEDYAAQRTAIGRVYREVIGRHFPAMAVVEVSRLVERRAKVEIQATAVLPLVRGPG